MFKSRRLFLILWRVLKIFGIVAVTIFFLFGIVTWIVFEKKNDWLLDRIQKYVKESQSGQLEIKTIDLKLFRNFPDVTIELNGINYFEHRDSLHTPDEKPILHADNLFVAFELMPLFKDELKVTVISLSKARINIVEYQDGKLNINLALAAPSNVVRKTSSKSPLQIDLNLISMNDMLVTWNSFATPNPSVFFIKNMEAELFKDGKILNAGLNAMIIGRSLYINGSPLPQGEISLNAGFRYEPEKQQLSVLESEIKYDAISVDITGTYLHKENRRLDLQVNASSKDLEFLSSFINPEIIKQNPDEFKKGNISIKGKIFGELNKQPLQLDLHVDASSDNLVFLSFIAKPDGIKKNADLLKKGNIYIQGRVFGELNKKLPQFEISFGMKNLALNLPDKKGSFRGVGFEGSFSSGNLNDFSEAVLEIKSLRGQLPGGFLKGQFTLRNFTDPYLNYNLDAKLNLDGYDKIFRMDFLKNLSGTIALQAGFNGQLKLITKHEMDNNRSSLITLSNLSFVVAKTNQLVSGLSGEIETRNNKTTIQHLICTYGKDDLQINATIDNLLYLLYFKESGIITSGNLRSNQIYTKDFILDTLGKAQVQDRISDLSFDFDIKTSDNKYEDSLTSKNIKFEVRNLKARFDKLPDIVLLDTKGLFTQTVDGPKLDLYNFHAIMPQGKIDVTGDMLIPKKGLVQFNSHVKTNKFPWTYVKELFAEISTEKEPNAKNQPVKEMDMVTADLNLSAELITYPFDINNLTVRNSRIHIDYSDSKSISAEKVNLAFDKFYFKHPENSGSLTGLKSTKGNVSLNQLKISGLNVFDINMNIAGENDKLDITFSRVAEMTRSENGHFILDISNKEPEYHLNYVVHEADLEFFIKKFYRNKFMTGKVNYKLDLSASGSNWEKAKQNLSGVIEIEGDSVQLYGIDIDELLKKFKKSQNFNLTDLGAVLVAGPVGLAITKGTNFVSLARVNFDSTSQTNIRTLLSKWRLVNRRIITEDVAITTRLNRIAFNGQVDFAGDSIPGLTIAVVDKNGCSLMDQKLFGKFGELKTGKLNITKTIFGSVINSVDAVVGKDCVPVYTGKVKNPSQ